MIPDALGGARGRRRHRLLVAALTAALVTWSVLWPGAPAPAEAEPARVPRPPDPAAKVVPASTLSMRSRSRPDDLTGAAQGPGIAPNTFVRVRNGRFVMADAEGRGERPFAFVGANLSIMHGRLGRAHHDEVLRAVAQRGMTVGRIWALGEGNARSPDWAIRQDLFRTGPDRWVEGGYRQLDRVLASAQRHGVRLIITLANNWADYGGIPRYLEWAGVVDIHRYGARERFFTDPQIYGWYRAHVERLLRRRNSVNGVLYRDDPTIFAWELVNEISARGPSHSGRRRWIDQTSRLIKRQAPNHMVAAGVIGYELLRERKEWIQVHGLPAIDFCDHHVYVQNGIRVLRPADLDRFIDDRAQLAHHVVKKPLVFGEFGFKKGERWLGMSRAALMDRFLTRAFYDGAQGALVWNIGPKGGVDRHFGIAYDDPDHAPELAVLERHARQVSRRPPTPRNPLLRAARADDPIDPPQIRRRFNREAASNPVPASGRVRALAIPVTSFTEASWERFGTWSEGRIVHAYGADAGYFEYRFAGPGEIPRRLTIDVRLSAEFPGDRGPPDGTSAVEVSIDGEVVGKLVAPADDGRGEWRRVEVTDPVLLGKLATGVHRLRLTVPRGPDGHGLCVYGKPGAAGADAPADARPLMLVFRF